MMNFDIFLQICNITVGPLLARFACAAKKSKYLRQPRNVCLNNASKCLV